MATNPGVANLVAYWPMDEAAGATRADSHTNGYDLTDNGTVSAATGLINDAADFTSSSTKYLSKTTETVFAYNRTENRSLSFWVNPDSVTGVQTLVSKWTTGSGQEWIVYLNGTSVVLGLTAGGAVVTNTAGLGTATWYHIVATFDSSGDGQIFVDAGTPATGNRATGTGGGGADVIFGNNSGVNTFNGQIDEACFFDDILTADEVDWLYNAGSGRSYSELVGAGFAHSKATIIA